MILNKSNNIPVWRVPVRMNRIKMNKGMPRGRSIVYREPGKPKVCIVFWLVGSSVGKNEILTTNSTREWDAGKIVD